MVVSVTSSALAMSVLLVRPSFCSNRMISRSTSSTGPRFQASLNAFSAMANDVYYTRDQP
jgi:hypothetical protein